MRWPVYNGRWLNRVSWFPIVIDGNWVWLERYQTRYEGIKIFRRYWNDTGCGMYIRDLYQD